MFSVVIPLYNKRDFIESTLASVLAQDFGEYEVIIVDDGSTDGSPDIVSAVSDSRIRLLRQSNQGVGPARNAGVRASAMPWIAFLDADDLWAPNHLSALHAIIAARPEAGFISTRWTVVGSTDHFDGELPLNGRKIEIREVDYFVWSVEVIRYFCTPSVAVRRELFDTVGGFGNFQPGQDVELWARLALATQVAVAMVTTCGLRKDEQGISARAVQRVATRDLSRDNLPSRVLELLDRHLRSGHPITNRRNIERYFDHRLLIGMRASLLSGDRVRTWKLWRLMLAPFDTRPLVYLAAAAAPVGLVRSVMERRARKSG